MSVQTTSTQTAPNQRSQPGQRAYTAYGAAAQLWACRDKEVVIEGPAGTGKSRSVLEKLHFCAMKYPKMRGLIARKTRESMTESVLVTFEEKVLPEGSPLTLGAERKNRQSYDYDNGSTIVIAGLIASGRSQRAKIMSTEYDMICVFEATELNEQEFEDLTTRLRNYVMPYQQIIADCNPDVPTHWLHQRCDNKVSRVFFSRHEDNPRLYNKKLNNWTAEGVDYVLGTLERLTGARKPRLRYGQRAAAEGAVYEFDRAVHLIDYMPTGWEAWRKIRGIDFGFTNPFTCQWWAIDGDGRLYLYREIYMSQRANEDHARQIVALSAGETYEATVADHDAEDRATLAIHGVPTSAAFKSIKLGIEQVQIRMKKAGDGKPRLFILSGALVEQDAVLEKAKKPLCTEKEFDGYIWPKGQDNKPLKEEPIKLNDHGMDTMRYVVAYVDKVGQSEIRVRNI